MTTKTTDISKMGEADWLKLRHPYLGSSDLPTILGEGYSGATYWQVWHEKSKPFLPPASDREIEDRMWWGKQMQRVIGEAVVRMFDWTVTEGQHHAADPDIGIAATVDFMAARPDMDGEGIIETKNRDWLFWKERYEDDKAWVYDEIQLASQMMLHPATTWGCIAVCVGGNELKVYDYRREELQQHMDTITSAAAVFWDKVRRGDEPEITFVDLPIWIAERDQLNELTEPRELPGLLKVGDEEIDTDELIDLYNKSSMDAKGLKKRADDLKARLLQVMGDDDFVTCEGFFLRQQRSQIAAKIITEKDVGTVARKASVRTTLKVVEKNSLREEREAREAELAKAAAAQAPLDMEAEHA